MNCWLRQQPAVGSGEGTSEQEPDAVSNTSSVIEDDGQEQEEEYGDGDGDGDTPDTTRKRKRQESSAVVNVAVQKLSSGEYETFERPLSVRGKPCKNSDKLRGIRHVETKTVIPAVQCLMCRKVLSSRGTSGTSAFHRHLKDSCPGAGSSTQSDLKNPPEWAREKMTKASAHYCALGLHGPNHFAGTLTFIFKNYLSFTIIHSIFCF